MNKKNLNKDLILDNFTKDKEFLFKLFDVLDECIHVIDKNGRTIIYSKGCEKIEHFKAEDVLGKPIYDKYKLNDNNCLNESNSNHLRVIKTGKPSKNRYMTYKTSNGDYLNIITSTYPIISNGEVVAAISIFRDITQMKSLTDYISRLQKDLVNQRKNNSKNGTKYHFNDIIGRSSVITNTIELAKKASFSNSPVLIYGETGTGKELFAQSIHNYSSNSDGPFIAINCSAIPESLLESFLFGTSKGAYTGAEEKRGLLEEAQNGTIFLDEINSMSMALQSKLLRALEDKTFRKVGSNKIINFNARIISAMNAKPENAINNKQIRKDLFYRLAVVTLEIPPLRNRLDDIYILLDHFINKYNKIMGKNIKNCSSDIIETMKTYDWPGNIRELEHAVEYSMNITDINDSELTSKHLPQYLKNIENQNLYKNYKNSCKENNLKSTLLKIETEIINEELKKNNNNISKTARNLGESRQYLQYRLKRLNINNK
jgi:arginine utilization regulatory protein